MNYYGKYFVADSFESGAAVGSPMVGKQSEGQSSIAERLREIEKVLAEVEVCMRANGDRMFGSRPARGASAGETLNPSSEPSLIQVIDGILDRALQAREEAARFNRIG